MADEIVTNGVLLQHIQALSGEVHGSKRELQQHINDLGRQIDRVEVKVDVLAQRMDQGFEEARQHRQALQEDLDATIRMVGKHEVKLARL